MVVALLTATATAVAQDTLKVSMGVDLVSRYMWRGSDHGDITLMPELDINWYGASLQLQGTAGLHKEDNKEINISLGYKYKFINAGLTDYWTSNSDFDGRSLYMSWDPVKNSHQLEANIGVDFGFLSVQAYTMIWGNDFKYKTLEDSENRTNGKRAFSTYIELQVPFYWKGIDWDLRAGVSPFESAYVVKEETVNERTLRQRDHFYANQFSLIMVSARATKQFKIGDVRTPVFAELHANPYLKRADFLVGVSVLLF